MVDFNKGYFPFFFNWVKLTARLSNEEFGMAVRALCGHFEDGSEPDDISDIAHISYAFMLDGAERAVDYQKRASDRGRENAAARWKKDEKNEKKQKNCSFDVSETFEIALERTYGKDEAKGVKNRA